MEISVIISIVFGLLILYLNALASLGIVYDHDLTQFQKTGQLLFTWLVPIFGASFILFLVYQHSPNAIPRSWIPWPISWLLFGKKQKSNDSRDEFGAGDYPGERDVSNSSDGADGGGDGD